MHEFMTTSEIVDNIDLSGGWRIEIALDRRAQTPRKRSSNLGHFYTWGPDFDSPDENPYADEVEFVADKLASCFSLAELASAVDAGGLGEQSIRASSARDDVELACSLANSPEAARLLSTRLPMLTVYRLDCGAVAYSTRPYSACHDACAVGFIWASMHEVREAFESAERQFPSGGDPDAGMVRRALEAFAREVEEYSCWANSEIYKLRLVHDDFPSEALTVSGVYSFDLEDVLFELRNAALRVRCAHDAS